MTKPLVAYIYHDEPCAGLGEFPPSFCAWYVGPSLAPGHNYEIRYRGRAVTYDGKRMRQREIDPHSIKKTILAIAIFWGSPYNQLAR